VSRPLRIHIHTDSRLGLRASVSLVRATVAQSPPSGHEPEGGLDARIATFDDGGRTGTFKGTSTKFDYLLCSPALLALVKKAAIFRKGMSGGAQVEVPKADLRHDARGTARRVGPRRDLG
jgi:hypothetical protein